MVDSPIQEAPISVDSTPPVDNNQIELGSVPNWILTPEVASSRAFKASYGLANTSAAKTSEDMQQGILSGRENELRTETSAKLNSDASQRRTDAITKAIADKNGPLSEDDMKWIDGTTGFNAYQGPYNPVNVFETNYSDTLMGELDNYAQKIGDTNFWSIAKQIAPSEQEAIKKYGSLNSAWRESLLTMAQNLQTEITNQSWPGYLSDAAKIGLVPGYYSGQLRGNAPGTDMFTGGFTAANLEAQRLKIIHMPFQQGMQTVQNISDGLKSGVAGGNPQLSLAFVMAMLGQSYSDKVMNTLNDAGDISMIPAVMKMGASTVRVASAFNASRQAAKDALIGTSGTVTREKILASVGDLPGAAVESVSNIVNSRINGSNADSVRESYDSLTRYFRTMKEDIKTDPANLSTTQRNALLEQVDTMESRVMATIATTLRPARVPIEKATREVITQILEDTKTRYPGMNNAVLDMSDPVLNPLSNTYHMTMLVGKNAGESFASHGEALQYAREHGFAINLSKDSLADVDLEIANIKEELKHPPSMEEDTAGLNRYYTLEDRLKELESIRKDGVSTGGHKIVSQGLGHAIELRGLPLDEKSRVVRDFLVEPTRASAVTPIKSWADWVPFGKYFRTSEDTMSAEANRNRKPTVYGQARIFAIGQEEAKYLERISTGPIKTDPNTGQVLSLPSRIAANVTPSKTIGRIFNRKQAKEFKQTLEYSQHAIDPDIKDGNNKGYYFKTVAELQKFYTENFNRLPSFLEIQAYQAQKNLTELHRILAEVSLYRNMSSVGTESHVLISKNAAGERVLSKPFNGVVQKSFPGGRGTILMEGETVGKFKSVALEDPSMTRLIKNSLSKELAEGKGKLIQIFNPEELPFNGFAKDGGNLNHYVYARNVESKPLSWEQVPRRGGGHLVPDYSHYLKQSIIKNEVIGGVVKNTYLGDMTAMPVANRVIGGDIAKKFNQVRALLKAGKEEEAKAFGTKYLPYEWNEFRGKFRETKDPNGIVHPPQFNLDEEFRVVPRNTAIIQLDNELESRYGASWRDGTKEKSLARNYQVEFTRQRDAQDLHTFKNVGTVNDPVYNIEPAKLVNPLQISDKSLSRMIHSFFFDDYKTAAVEAWIKEAAPYLDVKSPSELESSPFFHFNNPKYLTGASKSDYDVISTLKANRFKINQLVGMPSEIDNWLHARAQDIADSAYVNLGPRAAERAGQLVPQWLLPAVRDPSAFIRSITFNAFLGVFSIPQLFVQMSTFANIWAISPRHSAAGTAAMFMHQLTRINKHPEIVDHLDNLLSKIRIPGLSYFKRGEFTEAMNFLDRSGFGTVAGEYGPLSTMNHAKIMSSGTDTFLKWGQTPFREGERSTRLGAYYTAFREFRDAHPTGPITKNDELDILNRADLLYGNMSSASNSVLHTGVVAPMTQFYAYNIRQAELFLGKRLGETALERTMVRARIIAFNGALFGVPMAAGISGLPVGDSIRRWALDDGYVVGEKYIQSLLMEGIPSVLLALVNGGTYYNIGSRYGLQGFTQLREALSSDAPFWKIFGGAPFSFITNTFKNSQGFYYAMWYLMQGDTKTFPFKFSNLVDVFKDVQSVHLGQALWTAFNTGDWVNKHSDIIKSDVSAKEALFMTIFGLSDQRQTDVFNQRLVIKDREDNIKNSTNNITEALNKAFIARSVNDNAQSDEYMAQALGYSIGAKLTLEQWSHAISKAVKRGNNFTLIDRGNWEFYKGPSVPGDKQDMLGKAYRTIYQMKQQGK